jgi:uncharacterized membrane protein
MELTPIKIPEIPLPFEISALMHPPVVHFIVALPLIVLLLELVNLVAKKRAIGVVSFFLLILTVVAAAAAYLTGITDGKEAWDILSQAGQAELKDHKILGIYLMIFSAVVLVFKLLSSVIKKGLMKAIYLVVLIFFVAGILKQGKEGGELVYSYGANVEIVKSMDDKIFDLNEKLEELQEESKSTVDKVVEATKVKATKVAEEMNSTVEVVKEKVNEATEAVKVEAQTVSKAIDEKVAEVNESVAPETTTPEPAAAESVTPQTETPELEAITQPEVETVPAPNEASAEIATH